MSCSGSSCASQMQSMSGSFRGLFLNPRLAGEFLFLFYIDPNYPVNYFLNSVLTGTRSFRSPNPCLIYSRACARLREYHIRILRVNCFMTKPEPREPSTWRFRSSAAPL